MSDRMKALILFSIGMVVFIIICAANLNIFNYLLKSDIFKLDGPVEILMIGDSHIKSSLDPSLIDHSRNLANSTENYFCTYYKLRYILKANPGVKKVIIGFSYQNITKYQESFLFSDEAASSALRKYFLFFDSEGISRIKALSGDFLANYLKYKMGVPFSVYYDKDLYAFAFDGARRAGLYILGGFYSSRKSNLAIKLIEQKIEKYFYDRSGRYCGRSELLRVYLNKIIDLCREKDIEVYLFNAPLYIKFRELIPQQALKDFEDVKSAILQKYPDVVYIDYTGLDLADNQYGDGDHLNYYGASVVSREVNSILN